MQKDPKKNKTDLTAQDAINKLKELIKGESICLFCTELMKQPIITRPMHTQQVDDDGNIWFMSSIKSDKNAEIAQNNSVQLFYSNPGNSEYLSVLGNATISTDRNKIEELWSPFAKAWFQDGKDDADISLIKVVPQTAYYWDTKSNKMISMIQMLAAVVTGSAPDDGVEGTLKVK
ncbi:MAG: pyridoxamine 5'-phosphate oxidase family protein [Bacteroidia bacterium]